MVNMSTEYQFHKLSYMQRSLELANVKEEIEGLLRDRHIIDKKLEEKTHEQNDLTEKCVHHLHVLWRKGMMADFYCPKKWGVTATPVKSNGPYVTPPKPHSYGSSNAPNFVPSHGHTCLPQTMRHTRRVHLLFIQGEVLSKITHLGVRLLRKQSLIHLCLVPACMHRGISYLGPQLLNMVKDLFIHCHLHQLFRLVKWGYLLVRNGGSNFIFPINKQVLSLLRNVRLFLGVVGCQWGIIPFTGRHECEYASC